MIPPPAVPAGVPDAEDTLIMRERRSARRCFPAGLQLAALAEAKAAGKLVLLDCVATWCHWCHVSGRHDVHRSRAWAPIRDNVIAVRVDVDARPDVASRYEEWGWPATVVSVRRATSLASSAAI